MGVKQNIAPLLRQKNIVKYQLLVLFVIATLLAGIYLFIDRQGDLRFMLRFRGQVVITIILVAIGAGVSTLIFQTLTHNRILTPAVMGLESLFILIQTVMLFFFRSSHIALSGRVEKFFVETLLMMMFSALIYRGLFNMRRSNIYTLLLAGMVCGILFSSGAALLQRLLAPGEFAILQSRIYAQFTRTDPDVLLMAGAIIVLTLILVWRLRHRLDVIALGKDNAITLGIDYGKFASGIMLLVTLLVAMSTVLVGPLTFLGLLAANFTYSIIASWRHTFLLPGVILTGIIILLTGQLVLTYVLSMSGALSTVIEFCGGILFIILLLRRLKND